MRCKDCGSTNIESEDWAVNDAGNYCWSLINPFHPGGECKCDHVCLPEFCRYNPDRNEEKECT